MKFIHPSELKGAVKAPPSKSMTIRAIAAGFLSPTGAVIRNPSICRDAEAALDIVRSLGSRVIRNRGKITINERPRTPESRNLNCDESGLCIRLFAPIAGLYEGSFTITGKNTLLSRPVGDMEDAFKFLGGRCLTCRGKPPVAIKGPLRGGSGKINGSTGSQILTGLLMALPLCPNDSRIRVENPVSLPYIRMTLSVLKEFCIHMETASNLTSFFIPGKQEYSKKEFLVEGDWSGAAFFLTAAAVKGNVTLSGLNPNSLQADRKIIEALKSTGVKIETGPDYIRVKNGLKKSFCFDATHCPDLFPPLAVLACFCNGTSVIRGVQRLIHKESNRARAIQMELNRIGADIRIKKDRMIITGRNLRGGNIFSHQDHRIVMAGAVAGLLSQRGVEIKGWPCVRKSYPDFFIHLKQLGGKTS